MRLDITCWEDDASQLRREHQQDAPTADELIEVPCCNCGDPTTGVAGEDNTWVMCSQCDRWEAGL